MSNEDKIKAVINMVHHLQKHSLLEHTYAQYLLNIFSDGEPYFHWLNVVRFIESNGNLFSFYGITANLSDGGIYYRRRRVFW